MFTLSSVQTKADQMRAAAQAKAQGNQTQTQTQTQTKAPKAPKAKAIKVAQAVPVVATTPEAVKPEPTATLSNINEVAMLVYVGTSKMGKRKKDQDVTDQAIKNAQADEDSGAFFKNLFPQNVPQLKKIESILGQARDIYEAETLPWLDGGGRLLPATNFMTFSSKINDVKDELAAAVRDFQDIYDDLVNQQRVRLGSMFKSSDYPSKQDVGERFAIWQQTFPIPTGNDFRVTAIEASAADAIRKQIDESTKASMDDALLECYGKLWDVADHMLEILGKEDPKKSIKGSLIASVHQVTESIARLNFAGDPKLNEMANKVMTELGKYEAKDLREDETKRNEVMAKAQDMANTLGAILGM